MKTRKILIAEDDAFSKPVDWDKLHTLLDTLSGSERVQNARKGVGLYRPERILLAIILFILIVFGVQPSKAQPPFYPQNKPMLRPYSQGACWKSLSLGLTEEQIGALESLQRAYQAEATPKYRELMTLRLELQCNVSDKDIDPRHLMERHKKLLSLQTEFESLSFSYQMKARSILTKEQLEQLPQDCLFDMGIGYGTGMGIGRGPRRGYRY